MNKEKQIEEIARDIGEKQKGGWKFVGESEYTTDTTNEELAEHLVINKGYRKASDVAEEIFAEIEKMLLNNHIGHYKTVKDTWCYNFNDEIISELAELKKKYTEGEG